MDRICCIIDIGGFYLCPDSSSFYVRELGWADATSERVGCVRFDLRPFLNLIHAEDILNVNDQFNLRPLAHRKHPENFLGINTFSEHIHGLTFLPRETEPTVSYDEIATQMREIYSSCKTSERTLVAFSGGPESEQLVEYYALLLSNLNIEFIDLKCLACPEFNNSFRRTYGSLSCGYHFKGLRCSMAKVYIFREWLRNSTIDIDSKTNFSESAKNNFEEGSKHDFGDGSKNNFDESSKNEYNEDSKYDCGESSKNNFGEGS